MEVHRKYPKMDGLWGRIPFKWMTWRYPQFRKPPTSASNGHLRNGASNKLEYTRMLRKLWSRNLRKCETMELWMFKKMCRLHVNCSSQQFWKWIMCTATGFCRKSLDSLDHLMISPTMNLYQFYFMVPHPQKGCVIPRLGSMWNVWTRWNQNCDPSVIKPGWLRSFPMELQWEFICTYRWCSCALSDEQR